MSQLENLRKTVRANLSHQSFQYSCWFGRLNYQRGQVWSHRYTHNSVYFSHHINFKRKILRFRIYYLHRCSDDLLDFLRFQQPTQVSISHRGHRKIVPTLLFRILSPCSVDGIQLLKRRFGPNTKSSNMTSWSQHQQVQFMHVNCFDSRDVTERLGQTLNNTKIQHFSLIMHI